MIKCHTWLTSRIASSEGITDSHDLADWQGHEIMVAIKGQDYHSWSCKDIGEVEDKEIEEKLWREKERTQGVWI